MVMTAVKTGAHPVIEAGKKAGIPIKVCPWWGSVRERTRLIHKGCGGLVYPLNFRRTTYFCPECGMRVEAKDTQRSWTFQRRWVCPGGFYHNQIKWPEVRNGTIIIWEGPCRAHPGKHSKFHSHRQTVGLLDVDGQIILISIRVSNAWSNFLLGMDDGHPFVRPVKRREVTVSDALDSLVPNKVREAFILGLEVKRQGDWYFIPYQGEPKDNGGYGSYVPLANPEMRGGKIYYGAALVYGEQTRHTGEFVAYQSFLGLPYPAPLVMGVVESPDHPPLYLPGWHIAIRQRQATWGRRDRGGTLD